MQEQQISNVPEQQQAETINKKPRKQRSDKGKARGSYKNKIKA